MDSLLKDAQLAVRRLLRARGFALAVAGTLMIAIRANTVWSMAYSCAPCHSAPDQLVSVVNPVTSVRKGDGVSPLDFADWRREIRGFDGLAAYASSSASLTGDKMKPRDRLSRGHLLPPEPTCSISMRER